MVLTLESILESPNSPLFQEFATFLDQSYCIENLTFWLAARDYHENQQFGETLINLYIRPNSPQEINIPCDIRKAILEQTTLDKHVFDEAAEAVMELMRINSFIPWTYQRKTIQHSKSSLTLSSTQSSQQQRRCSSMDVSRPRKTTCTFMDNSAAVRYKALLNRKLNALWSGESNLKQFLVVTFFVALNANHCTPLTLDARRTTTHSILLSTRLTTLGLDSILWSYMKNAECSRALRWLLVAFAKTAIDSNLVAVIVGEVDHATLSFFSGTKIERFPFALPENNTTKVTGGVPKPCIYHPNVNFILSHAIMCLHMLLNEPDLPSFLLKKLPNSSQFAFYAWTVLWPAICQIVYKLNYHAKIPPKHHISFSWCQIGNLDLQQWI